MLYFLSTSFLAISILIFIALWALYIVFVCVNFFILAHLFSQRKCLFCFSFPNSWLRPQNSLSHYSFTLHSELVEKNSHGKIAFFTTAEVSQCVKITKVRESMPAANGRSQRRKERGWGKREGGREGWDKHSGGSQYVNNSRGDSEHLQHWSFPVSSALQR